MNIKESFKENKYLIIYTFGLSIFALGVCFLLYFKDNLHGNPLCITEICYKNDNMVHDENGVYGYDYIEIYNPSILSRRLTGCSLKDRKRSDRIYVFPDSIIPPKSFVIVWCGVDTIKLYGQRSNYKPRDFHNIDFSLKQGESCVLFDPKGRILSEVKLQCVPEGKVIASTKDNLYEFNISDPTPRYLENTYIISKEAGIKPDEPQFSAQAGCYEEPFYLELSSSEGTIHYTVDGTEPSEDSPVYDAPIYVYNRSEENNVFANIKEISITNDYVPDIPVDKCFVVKAIAVKDGERSDVACRTYIVDIGKESAYSNISIMSITTDPDNLFGAEDGIYTTGNVYNNFKKKVNYEELDVFVKPTNYNSGGRGWERPAHIELFGSKDHELLMEQDIGIRIHGGFSREYNQKSFNLYAREEYDGRNAFKIDFWGAKRGKILLRAGGYRDLYYTKLRDVFNQKLVEDRAIGIQRGEPCAVFINSEYWGLYNLQEAIDSEYIQTYYGVDEDDLILLKNAKVVTGNEDDLQLYDDMVQYASSNDMSIEANYRKLEEQMDIQSYIDYQCFEIFVGNCDSVNNNYCRWRSRTSNGDGYSDGRWRWILYDTDDSVAMVEGLTEASVDSFIEGHWGINPMEDELFAALLDNDEYKERFVATFMDIMKNNYSYANVSDELNRMAELYRAGVVRSQQRFRGGYSPEQGVNDLQDGLYTEEVFNKEIKVIADFYRERPDYIKKYMIKDLGLESRQTEYQE